MEYWDFNVLSTIENWIILIILQIKTMSINNNEFLSPNLTKRSLSILWKIESKKKLIFSVGDRLNSTARKRGNGIWKLFWRKRHSIKSSRWVASPEQSGNFCSGIQRSGPSFQVLAFRVPDIKFIPVSFQKI